MLFLYGCSQQQELATCWGPTRVRSAAVAQRLTRAAAVDANLHSGPHNCDGQDVYNVAERSGVYESHKHDGKRTMTTPPSVLTVLLLGAGFRPRFSAAQHGVQGQQLEDTGTALSQ